MLTHPTSHFWVFFFEIWINIIDTYILGSHKKKSNKIFLVIVLLSPLVRVVERAVVVAVAVAVVVVVVVIVVTVAVVVVVVVAALMAVVVALAM
jgi:hypothetical protein